MGRICIRGGTVVDGTGAPARSADVLVEDGVIVEVGQVDGAGAEVFDADGLLVTPGWVDVHTHYDGQVYWDPLMTPSSWHGATTVVMGNCGVGFAPVHPDQHDQLIDLMVRIEDIPGGTLTAGIPWGWETFGEYMACLDRTARAIDVGVLVPHGAVRSYVMGDRAERGTATTDEVAAIAALIDEGLAAGALGCSANRTLKKGAVVPGSFAADDELLAIARVVGAHGAVFQTSPAFLFADETWTTLEAESDLVRRMSLAGPCPVTFPVVQDHDDPNRWRRIIEWVDAANAEGAKLVPQVLARPLNAIMTLNGHHPMQRLPAYAELSAGMSRPELLVRLADPEVRDRILKEAEELLGRTWIFDALYPMKDPPDYEPLPEQSVGARARRQGRSPAELFYEKMLGDDGNAMFLAVVANYAEGNGDTVLEMIQHPATVLGLGDGGAHCTGLCDASTPTTVLTQWVRDRTRGPRLAVETAVRELTLNPARHFGLKDRGALVPGLRGDINLIDLDALQVRAPEFVYDLPGQGRRIVQRAEGYVATYVAGERVFDQAVDTGARPGRTIRHTS
jgi:N-acyl-D-aspartate/D-glutamate deacylase